jgi:hypothetical protein
MDQSLALKMLDVIKKLNVENLALRAILLTATRGASTLRIDALVKEAIADPAVRDTIQAQWSSTTPPLLESPA